MRSDDTRTDENPVTFQALSYFNFIVIDHQSGDFEKPLSNVFRKLHMSDHYYRELTCGNPVCAL